MGVREFRFDILIRSRHYHSFIIKRSHWVALHIIVSIARIVFHLLHELDIGGVHVLRMNHYLVGRWCVDLTQLPLICECLIVTFSGAMILRLS